jgi:hypothetical protein
LCKRCGRTPLSRVGVHVAAQSHCCRVAACLPVGHNGCAYTWWRHTHTLNTVHALLCAFAPSCAVVLVFVFAMSAAMTPVPCLSKLRVCMVCVGNCQQMHLQSVPGWLLSSNFNRSVVAATLNHLSPATAVSSQRTGNCLSCVTSSALCFLSICIGRRLVT